MRLLWYRTIQTHTDTPSTWSHFSSNFSKVFNCMVWICCTSFILVFLFKLFWKKKKEPNLLLLSLDNGRLCISCICIHKIKMKAEIFPVWDCYLVFVHVLWLLLSVYENGFHQPFWKTKQNQKATMLWTSSVVLTGMFKKSFVRDDSDY